MLELLKFILESCWNFFGTVFLILVSCVPLFIVSLVIEGAVANIARIFITRKLRKE